MAKKKVTTTTTTTTTVTTTTTTAAPTKSRLVFVLDRSGSMNSMREAAIGGFNKFVEQQRALEGEATISLVIFDDKVEMVFDSVDLKTCRELTQADFVPRGYTALYDALGQTINRYRDSHQDDTKTIIAVMTDGAENASKEFTQHAIAELIKDVEGTLGWETIFIGANIDVKHIARSLNIKATNATTFTASAKGMEVAYACVNNATTAYRSGSTDFSFDPTQPSA